jgi:lipoyl synthase
VRPAPSSSDPAVPEGAGDEGAPNDAGAPSGARLAKDARTRKPDWLRVQLPPAPQFRATAGLVDRLRLHTVCDEARCPNKGECFAAGTATFLILGDECSRACGFCSVKHGRPGGAVDADEPRRVAQAAQTLCLRHVVVTSVTRDDLADGGARQFADTIAALRRALPDASVEVLIPDFGGDEGALATVLAERPHVLNHNLETVPRLYVQVRPQANYERSLALLRRASASARATVGADMPGTTPEPDESRNARACAPGATGTPGASGAAPSAAAPRLSVKTGLMVGLGETWDEVDAVLADCAAVGVDMVTVGQYLQPRRGCLPVVRFVPPEEFVALEERGAALGLHVIAAPFVRSSYRAGEAYRRVAGDQERSA